MKIPKGIEYVIGIDEAGRGPLAGPVSVGAVCFCVSKRRRFSLFSKGVRDSKKLSEKQREEWFIRIEKEVSLKKFSFAVSFSSSEMIDTRGLSFAIRNALLETLEKLACPYKKTLILLDGSLHAPKEYPYQKTIIHGDDIEPVISLASIVAKVLRDRKMRAISQQYPEYGFERNKGYGTKKHYEMLRKYGVLKGVHRNTFLGEK